MATAGGGMGGHFPPLKFFYKKNMFKILVILKLLLLLKILLVQIVKIASRHRENVLTSSKIAQIRRNRRTSSEFQRDRRKFLPLRKS